MILSDKPLGHPESREIAQDATRRIRALAQTVDSQLWVDAHWPQIVRAIEDAILKGNKAPK